MLQNELKLNDLKTECIVFAPKSKKHLFNDLKINIGDSVITPTDCVRNLGAYLDSELTLDNQVNQIVKTGYYHLRRISKIRCHLDQETCAKAVIAFVSSRLDCHNGLLCNANAKQLRKLQVLQNDAARLVTKNPRRSHATPLLEELHWLPVRERIKFKLMSVVHTTIYNAHSPSYLKELCVPVSSSAARTLRSSSSGALVVPRSKKVSTDAAFGVTGCRLFNSLPTSLRLVARKETFKTALKTFLFNCAFQ
jgi:hypothetical protein